MRLTLRLLGLFMLMTFAACGGGGEDRTCPTTEAGWRSRAVRPLPTPDSAHYGP